MNFKPGVTAQDFPKIAKDMGFSFSLRRGRVDWHKIDAIDIDRLVQEKDLVRLQDNLVNVVNYNLENEYDVKILDPNFVKLFKLAQLSVDYLMYAEQNLYGSIELLQHQLTLTVEEIERLKQDLKKKDDNLKNMRKQLKERDKNHHTMGSEGSGVFKCQHCDKAFRSGLYLEAHHTRRHPGLTFMSMPVHTTSREVEQLQLELKLLREQIQQREDKENVPVRQLDEKIDDKKEWEELCRRQLLEWESKYKEELSSLKNLFCLEVQKLKEPGRELVDMVALKDQEILLLREQLSRQASPQLLESQEAQWKAQLLAVEQQYSASLAELREQLASAQDGKQQLLSKSEYENKIHDLVARLASQEEQIEALGKQIGQLSEQSPLHRKELKEASPFRIVPTPRAVPPTPTVQDESSLSSEEAPPLQREVDLKLAARERRRTLQVKSFLPSSSASDVVIHKGNTLPLTKMQPVDSFRRQSASDIHEESDSHSHKKKPTVPNIYSAHEESDSHKRRPSVSNIHSTHEESESHGHKRKPTVPNIYSAHDESDSHSHKRKPSTPNIYSTHDESDSDKRRPSVSKVHSAEYESDTQSHKKRPSVSKVRSAEYESDTQSHKRRPSDESYTEQRRTGNPAVVSVSARAVTSRQAKVDNEGDSRARRRIMPRDESSSSESSTDEEVVDSQVKALAVRNIDSLEDTLAANPHILAELKLDIQSVLERRLRELGVDPEWEGIPSGTFTHKMETLQHHQNITAKRLESYFQIREMLLQQLEARLLSSSQSTLDSIPDKEPGRMNKLVSSVKEKARSVFTYSRRSKRDKKQRTPTAKPRSRLRSDVIDPKAYRQEPRGMYEETEAKMVTSTPNKDTAESTATNFKNRQVESSYSSSEEEEPSVRLAVQPATRPGGFKEVLLSDHSSPAGSKSNLKSATGSFAKKRVLFAEHDDVQHIAERSAEVREPLQSEMQPSPRGDSRKSKVARLGDESDDSDWENESDTAAPRSQLTDNSYQIQLSTRQSQKIAEISRNLEQQLGIRRNKPTGGVEAMFAAGLQDTAPTSNDISTMGSTHGIALDKVKQAPVAKARTQTSKPAATINTKDPSDWDLEDFDD